MALDRDQVVRTALELLNEVGIDGLTTRRLAERLGVKQPALYWHFRNKRELLDEMAARMLTETRLPAPMTKETWREVLKENSRSFRQALLRYRDGARVHAGTAPDVALYPSLEGRLQAMCEAGFTPGDGLRAFMTMGRFVVGWVIEEQAASEAGRTSTGEEMRPDPVAYPTLAAGLAAMRQGDADADFEFGLEALVAGVAAERDERRAMSGEGRDERRAMSGE